MGHRVSMKSAGSRGAPVRRRRGRVADADRAHRLPAVRQPERRRRHRAAEHRARHPARAEPLDGQRDQQVLHGGARRRRRTSPARRPPAGRPGRLCAASVTRHGTMISGARRSGSPRRTRRAICSSVNPSPRRSVDPRGQHVVEQRGPRLRRLHDREPPRRGVVRRGRGQRGRDRAAHRHRVDRLGGELAHRPPGGQHVRRRRAGTCPRPRGGSAPRRPARRRR